MWDKLFDGDGLAIIAGGVLCLAIAKAKFRGKHLVVSVVLPLLAILVGILIILRNFCVF